MSPFGKLLEKLARAEVRYVLVGGGAVLLHGHARNTNDLDILVEANEENARRLLQTLASWGEGAAAELTIEEFAHPQVGCVRIVEEFALDVFTLMVARRSGQSIVYADLIDDAEQKDLGAGIMVNYASIARLLDLKAASGRPKDASDIAILSEIALGRRERTPVDLTMAEPSTNSPTSSSEQGNWPLPGESDAR